MRSKESCFKILGKGKKSLFHETHFRVSSPTQSQSKAVVYVSTPRMYPRSGYFLVHTILVYKKFKILGQKMEPFFQTMKKVMLVIGLFFIRFLHSNFKLARKVHNPDNVIERCNFLVI